MKLNRLAFGRFALTHVAVAALTLSSTASWGLGLGRLSVQSALGETLKAEIDISTITPEELGTLKARIASPEAFRASGVEFNSVLSGAEVQLMRRPDGRQVLRIQSDRAVQEPFVDVILEISWSSGRLVREYTLLFDPPSLARPFAPAEAAVPARASVLPLPPQPAQPPVPPPAAVARVPASAAPVPAPVAAAPRPVPAPAPVVAVEPPARRPAAASAPSEYAVKPGDMLSRVAGRTKPAGISLDQMLVGLFRANPDAFIGENMNLLKAGSVLQIPGSDVLAGVSGDEARKVIQAQSADFNAYRQRLAGAAPELRADAKARQAKGEVQAAVAERKPSAASSPDKLTLSKASAAAASEAKISRATEKKADNARVAELTRNVEELKKLSSEAKPAAAAASAPAAPIVKAAASAPAITTAALPAAAVAAASVALPASRPAPAAAPQAQEPGLLAGLLDNPLLLPIAAVLVALLGGVGLMRLRGKVKPKSDTGFHESRLQPDSFFAASGGQRVDTRDATSSGASSMSYSLSQLDAIGDVDPVAEADVYLAYGRDLQAEEILKEALRATPERVAIRLKLLEVYAKRRDTKGFEQLAAQLYVETQGQGEDWAKAQELGRQIDADNPLYQPGGAPALLSDGREMHPEPMGASTMPLTVQHSSIPGGYLATQSLQLGAAADAGGPVSALSGLDLDLDLDLDAEPSSTSMAATQAMAVSVEQTALAMDFDLGSMPLSPAASPARAEPAGLDMGDLAFDLDEIAAPTAQSQPAAAAAAGDPSALDFDLSGIDLDLPAKPDERILPTGSTGEASVAEFDSLLQEELSADPLSKAFDALEGDGEGGDPLQRQLELADEFRQIGDTEGARDVLQELLAKASGPLRDQAQAMLKALE